MSGGSRVGVQCEVVDGLTRGKSEYEESQIRDGSSVPLETCVSSPVQSEVNGWRSPNLLSYLRIRDTLDWDVKETGVDCPGSAHGE